LDKNNERPDWMTDLKHTDAAWLKIEQISVVLLMRFILNRKSEFIINDTILYPLGGVL
jgi:hypothetical protein